MIDGRFDARPPIGTPGVILLSSTGQTAARPGDELRRALDILGRHVRREVDIRRSTPRWDPRHRRAGEELTRLSGLYRRMQRRMEIPPEVWELDDHESADPGGAGSHGRGRRP